MGARLYGLGIHELRKMSGHIGAGSPIRSWYRDRDGPVETSIGADAAILPARDKGLNT